MSSSPDVIVTAAGGGGVVAKKERTKGDDDDDDDDDGVDGGDPEDDKRRFEYELEFVQCLASPAYLHFLATYRGDDDDDDDDDDTDDNEDDADDEEDETMEEASDDVDDARKPTGRAASLTPKKKSKLASASSSGTGLLRDAQFLAYLRYLRDTWSRPEYAIYLSYPHGLYFLNLLVEQPTLMAREWAQPAYRNFCHQQQFLAWQHRHANLYGHGLSGGGAPADASAGAEAAPTHP